MTEGALACGYHGWRFDGSGACVHIPSLVRGQRIAKGCEVPAFKTVEQDGYVWIWVGETDPGSSLPARVPDFDRLRWLQGSVEMKCDALKAIQNNLDWCHPYFAHPFVHRQYVETQKHGFREQQYEMRVSERGLELFAPVTQSDAEPAPTFPTVRLSYELPSRVTVDFYSPRKKLTRIVMHAVPTGPNTCRLEWLFGPNPIPLLGGRVAWSSREPKIIRQDRVLIESSQPWYDRDQSFESSVEADASTLLLRRIHDMAIAGTWPEKWSSLPRRRLVDVRA
jgi:phenylpropionate dioxygenase-like ring-hydroxylating dioxygenase large terminal subunit